ncbi:MAG: hypothetical protein ACFFB2_03625 [Promethearchaeota archaeon]
MGDNPILKELKYIQDLIDESLDKMDEILRPKTGTVFWRLIFPAGQFMQQKSTAKAAAAILINIGARLKEMVEVLEERDHPLTQTIRQLLDPDLFDMAERIVELPERAQYIFPQLENQRDKISQIIKEIK